MSTFSALESSTYIILIILNNVSFVNQDLPAEEIKEELIESGHADEILQKTCPAEYCQLKEEEVTEF